jgi:hypothetical protein
MLPGYILPCISSVNLRGGKKSKSQAFREMEANNSLSIVVLPLEAVISACKVFTHRNTSSGPADCSWYIVLSKLSDSQRSVN